MSDTPAATPQHTPATPETGIFYQIDGQLHAMDVNGEDFLLSDVKNYADLLALAQRVANLNPDHPGIGAGMLKSLVAEARRLTEERA